jgi:hypothetical protein
MVKLLSHDASKILDITEWDEVSLSVVNYFQIGFERLAAAIAIGWFWVD